MSLKYKIGAFQNILKNMGWRYVGFRSWFELSKRTGLLKGKFPTNPSNKKYISLEEWKKLPIKFFFDSKESIRFARTPNNDLEVKAKKILNGELQFFNAEYKEIGKNYDWITNPDTGYQYNTKTHWVDINDFSGAEGDIKYVWEKSRFSYLNTIIRYDFHFEKDCSEWVFNEIENWISANPINCGPNYKCSQEVSLRLLNWIFALYFYKNSPSLTESRFEKIIHYCYWQLHHVRNNIHFSRIAVRNNHAITETLMLYLCGIFFPFFPESKQWSIDGLKWLEEEVEYQVYEDGTYIQFSHNYHRVLIQLLTWGIRLSELNQKQLSSTFLSRTEKTLNYLFQCSSIDTGALPNYGNNDGALFFSFNDNEFHDFRSQLNALSYTLKKEILYSNLESFEDVLWFHNLSANEALKDRPKKQNTICKFPIGGIYTFRSNDTFTFIKCASFRDRPGHSDNLHVDIWDGGNNIFRDSGTYKYNTDPKYVKYFQGVSSHNTLGLDGHDQMEKGARFIWLYWSNSEFTKTKETDDCFSFEGQINAFKHLNKGITHNRKITISKHIKEWTIEDEVKNGEGFTLNQYWLPNLDFLDRISISAEHKDGSKIKYKKDNAFYSSIYGIKEETPRLIFSTKEFYIKTIIRINQ